MVVERKEHQQVQQDDDENGVELMGVATITVSPEKTTTLYKQAW